MYTMIETSSLFLTYNLKIVRIRMTTYVKTIVGRKEMTLDRGYWHVSSGIQNSKSNFILHLF